MSIQPESSSQAPPKGHRLLIGAAIALFAVLSAYLGLVIVTRLDGIFLPPNKQITLPGAVGNVLPGVDTQGDSGPKDRINILVMGLDRRPRDGDTPTRTDTIFVVTVDPKTNSTGILGFPRDMVVDIPGRYGGTFQDRINTVYANGELSDYDGGGIGLMKRVLGADPFNIKIDKYVIVDFKSFENMIDELGGIDVDVPEEVYDPYYSETELPGDYLPQHFYPGTQHMDGQTALAYSRIRFSSDDLDRIQRQQRVIFAAIDKAQSQNLLNVGKMVSLWDKYKDTIKTDVSDFEIPKYAGLALAVKDNIHAVSLGPATVPYTTDSGAAVLIASPERVREIVDAVFSDQAASAGGLAQAQPTPAPVNVQVQNATDVDGLARRVVAYIASKGYPTESITLNNVFDGQPHQRSEILDLDGTRNDRTAYLIADWLGIPTSAYREATATEKEKLAGSGASLVVILADDVDFEQQIQSPTTTTPGG